MGILMDNKSEFFRDNEVYFPYIIENLLPTGFMQ